MPLRPDGVVTIEDCTPRVRGIRPIIRCMDKAFSEDDDGTGWTTIVVHHFAHIRLPRRLTDIRTIPVGTAVIEVRLMRATEKRGSTLPRLDLLKFPDDARQSRENLATSDLIPHRVCLLWWPHNVWEPVIATFRHTPTRGSHSRE